MPLLQGVCKLIYTFCKIRGPNVISRFYSNEPRYLEPMLDAFEARTERSTLSWEEKYIFQLWLSHLALAPFDLSTVGGNASSSSGETLDGLFLPANLPSLATRMISDAVANVGAAGKEREAAVFLLVRVMLRPDIRRLGIHESAMHWVLDSLHTEYSADTSDSIYRTVSLLAFVANFVKYADVEVVRPFLLLIFRRMRDLSEVRTQRAVDMWASALARKVVIKIYGIVSVAAIQADLTSPEHSVKLAEYLLDNVIGHFLESLGHNDTPVRFAASKAISVVTSKLGDAMVADVSEAILESLKEDVLMGVDRLATVQYGRETLAPVKFLQKRSLAGVNGLRWHGLVLVLSQLLYRRAPPVAQLPQVIDALLLALAFEQRSSSGISTGGNVRDAACFGIWALARKYTTDKLCSLDVSAIGEAIPSTSILQTLAVRLMTAAACDPSGNIRRGASAALQELIGRHPDTVVEGIRLVQTVDYHAVALRSRALEQVAVEAASLDTLYWEATVNDILSWRGINGANVDSRRLAARALGLLAEAREVPGAERLAEVLLQSFHVMDGSDVKCRHGIFLAAAAILRASKKFESTSDVLNLRSKLLQFWGFLAESSIPKEHITSRILRPDLTVEAVCILMSALASFCGHGDQRSEPPPPRILKHCVVLLQLCLSHRSKLTLGSATMASKDLSLIMPMEERSSVLLQWIRQAEMGQSANAGSIGYLRALGAICEAKACREEDCERIKKVIVSVLNANPSIEIKIAALQSLKGVLVLGSKLPTVLIVSLAHRIEVMDQTVVDALHSCLDDYTTDQRGDVGSLVRLEAIEAVRTAFRSGSLRTSAFAKPLVSMLCTLAAEKLDKCRFQAWGCLSEFFEQPPALTAAFDAKLQPAVVASGSDESDIRGKREAVVTQRSFADLSGVSSVVYFESLLSMSYLQDYQASVLKGLVSSIGSGSESVMIASRGALTSFLERLDVKQRASIFNGLESVLRTYQTVERLLIPSLETLAYVLDQVSPDLVDNDLVP